MRLYFQAGKNTRMAIDTNKRTWNNNFFYLGAFKEYIHVSRADFLKIRREIDFNCYDYDENF